MRLIHRTSILALAASLACGGNGATRYTGSAMNDAEPDSASPLTLTLWSHTDTSFSGRLRLASPLGGGGGGSAYLWHEGSMLRMVTVSADGDTAVWTSQQTDESIGGKYNVTGGPGSGGGGTWRAQLSEGPPVSPETLRRANGSIALPPLDAVWPVLLIVTFVVAAIRWIGAAPSSIDRDAGSPIARAGQVVGIGGWLSFFVLGQLVAVVVTTTRAGELAGPFRDGTWELGSAVAGMHGLLVMEALMHVAQIAAPVIGLYLTFSRTRHAPRFWFAYLLFIMACAAIDVAGGAWLGPKLAALTGPRSEAAIDSTMSRAQTMNLRTILFALGWGLYWIHSIRVKATFGHGALDKPVAPSTGVQPIAAD